MKSDTEKVLFIVGPTASGKSEVAFEIARRLKGEIISADSMQVYRGMDIGTAKPSAALRRRIPHHLIDILRPSQSFSVFHFRRLALAKIRDVSGRGKLPIVAGGTGLYVRSLLQGLSDYDLPPLSRLGFECCVAGLTRPRSELYTRIEARVDRMFRAGLVAEVRRLPKRLSRTASQALGYKEIRQGMGADLIKKNTRHYAKRQMTWFRKEPGLVWFEWREGDSAKVMGERVREHFRLHPARLVTHA